MHIMPASKMMYVSKQQRENRRKTLKLSLVFRRYHY